MRRSRDDRKRNSGERSPRALCRSESILKTQYACRRVGLKRASGWCASGIEKTAVQSEGWQQAIKEVPRYGDALCTCMQSCRRRPRVQPSNRSGRSAVSPAAKVPVDDTTRTRVQLLRLQVNEGSPALFQRYRMLVTGCDAFFPTLDLLRVDSTVPAAC